MSPIDPSTERPTVHYVWLDPALGLDMAGDAEALAELLDLAEQSLTRDLPAIDQCLLAGDAKGANDMLHAIKGFVPIFCVPALVEHVTRVEYLGKSAEASDLAQAYADLAPQLQALRDEILTYRGSQRQ